MDSSRNLAGTEASRPRREEVIERMDRAHVEAGRLERERLRAILECDRHELWRGEGCRDHAEFLAGRYGISKWKARRWIGTAYALECLPVASHALCSGALSIDKVVELTRFATPATERKLVAWARRVTPAGIRDRADRETRMSLAQLKEVEADRHLRWSWHLDGGGLEIEARVPAQEGAVFIAAVDRLAKDLPDLPPDEGAAPPDPVNTIDGRRADALVLLCSARIADDQDPDRATVVVHAPHTALVAEGSGSALAEGPALHARTVQRLACSGRLDVTLYGLDGAVVGIGRASREAPFWLRRQVLVHDGYTCTFSGCGMKRFLQLHHIREWELGGPTNLDNLIAVCHTHHKLVHEHGWKVILQHPGVPVWFRPNGRRFEPGPAPPADAESHETPPETNDDAPWPQLWHLLQGDDHALTRDTSIKRILKLGASQIA